MRDPCRYRCCISMHAGDPVSIVMVLRFAPELRYICLSTIYVSSYNKTCLPF